MKIPCKAFPNSEDKTFAIYNDFEAYLTPTGKKNTFIVNIPRNS